MSDFFTGDERLEPFPPLGYPMRMGNPAALSVGDHERLDACIRERDAAGAHAYLASFHPQNVGMQLLVLEWCLQLPQTLEAMLGSDAERDATRGALEVFRQEVRLLEDEHGSHEDVLGAIDDVASLLDADNLLPPAADRFRSDRENGRTGLDGPLLARLSRTHRELAEALDGEDFERAADRAARYHRVAVTNHDALINFTNTYPTHAAATLGEDVAHRLAADSLKSCPAYMGLWEHIKGMETRELAAFLAEHLRFHFSGPGRTGATEIIEDEEKIRLVFDPCGSGGALRRRLGDRMRRFRQAGDATWGRADEVPCYCTHCALNERISTELFGYPRMVTEFDPDPDKPCGWTVYKDPAAIPAEYFRRIGYSGSGHSGSE